MEEVSVEIPAKSADSTTTTTTPPTKAIETCPTEKIVIEEQEQVEMKKDAEEVQKAPETSSHAQSLSHLLPPHSYAQISPRCYLFHGAEVTADNMDDDGNSDGNSDESDDEEEEDEVENNEFSDEEEMEETPDEARSAVNEILVPDIDNCQVMSSSTCEVPEISPAPSTNSVSSPARSQLECGDRETVETIDANIHNDDNDLEPAPLKKPRLETEESIF